MVPHLETINYLAAINYTWHTFVDPDDVSNEYVKSITILDGQYNVFNEDYHVEHHLRPGVHWTTVYDSYVKRNEEYKKNSATIFKDTMEFELFFCILLNDIDFLAEHFVDLSGKMVGALVCSSIVLLQTAAAFITTFITVVAGLALVADYRGKED